MIADKAPIALQVWIIQPPNWLQIHSIANTSDIILSRLDAGEKEAILLAEMLKADLILLDDRAARKLAKSRGLQVVGLLGILDEAATLRLIDLPSTITRLRQTSFRVSPSLLDSLLGKYS